MLTVTAAINNLLTIFLRPLRALSLPVLATVLLLAGCAPRETESERANGTYDQLFMESLRESPEYMAYLGMRERYGEWDRLLYTDGFTDKWL